ncbi:MAG: hypothetical protein WB711_19070 [Terriglobales bacterium]
MNELVESREQLEPAEGGLPRAVQECSAGQSAKYLCLRCGWHWSPRRGCPDPPNACARCRSAYWNTPPDSARANRPDDPKWKAERDALAERRRARHTARLKELIRELAPDAAEIVRPALLPPEQTAVPDLQPAPKPVALSGDKLASIMLADLHDVLSRDRMFSPFFTYRRPSYSVRVVLHVDKPVHLDPLQSVPQLAGH